MEGTLAAVIGVLIGCILLSLVVAGFFMWIGAKMAGVPNSTFGKAIVAALVVSLLMWLLPALFSIVPVLGTLVGLALGLVFSIFAIQGVFSTTFARALLVWVFNVLAQLIVLLIAVFTFAGAVLSMGG